MKKSNKQRTRDRAALARRILRAMREAYLECADGPGRLSASTQAELWGLERARRRQ